MPRQLPAYCKDPRMWAKDVVGQRTFKVGEDLEDFRQGVIRQGTKRLWSGVKAFGRGTVGKDDLMGLEHQVEIGHFLASMHDPGHAAFHSGQINRTHQNFIAVAAEHDTVLRRNDQRRISTRQGRQKPDRFDLEMQLGAVQMS